MTSLLSRYCLGTKVFCPSKKDTGTVTEVLQLSVLIEWDNPTDDEFEWVPKADLVEADIEIMDAGENGGRSVREQPESPLTRCTLTDLPSIDDSVREQDGCTLTSEEKLHPNTWIEEKLIRRSGKLHGPYRYERWRDPATGKMKSRYLGKLTFPDL